MIYGKLYLIPSGMGDQAELGLPAYALAPLQTIQHYVAENPKTARHFLKTLQLPIPLQQMQFSELSKHTAAQDLPQLLQPALEGHDLGLLSEAGCPGVADPGADLVRLAHQKGIEVRPLVGPSAILLALMASGMNGQCFAFQGYLPIDKVQRRKQLQFHEQLSAKQNQTQIFIETPYRNQAFFEDALESLKPQTLLGLAVDLLCPNQYIKTQSIQAWKKDPQKVDLHKRPCVFTIYAS